MVFSERKIQDSRMSRYELQAGCAMNEPGYSESEPALQRRTMLREAGNADVERITLLSMRRVLSNSSVIQT